MNILKKILLCTQGSLSSVMRVMRTVTFRERKWDHSCHLLGVVWQASALSTRLYLGKSQLLVGETLPYNGWELYLWQRAGCKLFLFPWLIVEVESITWWIFSGWSRKKKNISALLQCLSGLNRKKEKGKRGKVLHIPFLLNMNALHRCWQRSDPGKGEGKGICFQIISEKYQREKRIALKLKVYEKWTSGSIFCCCLWSI